MILAPITQVIEAISRFLLELPILFLAQKSYCQLGLFGPLRLSIQDYLGKVK